MKTLIWSLGYPIVCAIYMVARASAFRPFTESEYAEFSMGNTLFWLVGILLTWLAARVANKGKET